MAVLLGGCEVLVGVAVVVLHPGNYCLHIHKTVHLVMTLPVLSGLKELLRGDLRHCLDNRLIQRALR